MIKFKRITIQNINNILPYINQKNSLISDNSIGFLIMWNKLIKAHYSIMDNTLVLKYEQGEGDVFLFPIGTNIDSMLGEIFLYTKEINIPLRFYGLNDFELNYLIKFKNLNFTFSYDDKWSDYIYSLKESLTFSGKKYKGQRNHINRFIKLYGEPAIKQITNREDIEKINKMIKKYKFEHKHMNLLENYEFLGTKKILDNYFKTNLIGIYIELNNEAIAVSIGEIIKDTLIIHIEKALAKYEGIYPTIYNSFVNFVNSNINNNLLYINREDDAGDAGLKLSKEQYKPIKKEIKYQVSIKRNDVNTSSKIILNDKNIILSNITFDDIEQYHKLCIDNSINKYFGYDYKKDIYLDFPISPNSFYNAMKLDNAVGDSINLAIRLKDDNKLIGEVILWHFTFNNDVELGIRLFEEYHNKQIGKIAFALLTKYAKENLKLKPKAKCYKENISSYKMILNCNYKLINEDDKFYYFEY